MEEEKMDEEVKDTQEEEPDEQVEDTQSEESDEDISPDKAYKLAQALQKGYTITRQEMAEIKENLGSVQSALSELNSKKEEYGGYDDEPLTVKKLLEMQNQEATRKQQENIKIDKLIDSQLSDLKIQGRITTKEDENKLLDYAVSKKMTNLLDAADRMEEIENARREGRKELAKGNVRKEVSSQIGTSKKVETKEQEGVPYSEMRKDMSEIAREE